eukprot:SAG11_NODE_4120_length_2055_cov_34.668712_2_plen_97_part_00
MDPRATGTSFVKIRELPSRKFAKRQKSQVRRFCSASRQPKNLLVQETYPPIKSIYTKNSWLGLHLLVISETAFNDCFEDKGLKEGGCYETTLNNPP